MAKVKAGGSKAAGGKVCHYGIVVYSVPWIASQCVVACIECVLGKLCVSAIDFFS